MKEFVKKAGCIVLICGLYGLFLSITNIRCPFKFFLGIPCLGCGMTRACMSLLTLDISQAVAYHPLILALPFMLLFVLLDELGYVKSKKFRVIAWSIIVGLFVVTYLIRLIFLKDVVVQINMKDALFYKILTHLGKEI